MSSKTNRRAVLGGILVAGAIGAATIPTGASTTAESVSGHAGLDAGLFALIDEARDRSVCRGGSQRPGGGGEAHRRDGRRTLPTALGREI
jgi:hypothetical protein